MNKTRTTHNMHSSYRYEPPGTKDLRAIEHIACVFNVLRTTKSDLLLKCVQYKVYFLKRKYL